MAINDHWYRPESGPAWLSPASWLYERAQLADRRRKLKEQLENQEKLNCLRESGAKPPFVIAVGNVNVGGTGKTPATLWLVEYLKRMGHQPAILTRGYGVKRAKDSVLSLQRHTNKSKGKFDPAIYGDEPVLLHERSKELVVIANSRMLGLLEIIKKAPEVNVVVCDDALQHYQLPRHYELAVVDAGLGFGNGQLLPKGPLRENPARLQHCDNVLINGAATLADVPDNVKRDLERFVPREKWLMSTVTGQVFKHILSGKEVDLVSMKEFATNNNVLAMAGMAHPHKFFNTLAELGIATNAQLGFSDHAAYGENDFRRPEFSCADYILCTEKDAEKCRAYADERWFYLPVELLVEEKSAQRFHQQIAYKLESFQLEP